MNESSCELLIRLLNYWTLPEVAGASLSLSAELEPPTFSFIAPNCIFGLCIIIIVKNDLFTFSTLIYSNTLVSTRPIGHNEFILPVVSPVAMSVRAISSHHRGGVEG